MNIFEDSINLLQGAAFTNVTVNDSYIFLESPAIFSEYIVPLTFFDKFDIELTNELFLDETEEGKNISYYVRQTLIDDYKDYLRGLKLSEDYIDSYLVKEIKEIVQFDAKETKLLEVTDELFDDYEVCALEIFDTWSNEKEYVDYFHKLAASSTETKIFKDFILDLNGSTVSIASVIFDVEMNLAYIHNAGTLNDFRRNGYFSILNNFIINKAFEMGINRVYTITEQDSESYGAYKKLGFKEQDVYYSYS